MEEKKTKKIVRKDAENKEAAAPAKSGSTVGLRIGSVVLWAVAIACEVLCILLLNGTFYVPISMMAALIIGIVIDLVCVVVAAMLWKKANRIKPMKEGRQQGRLLSLEPAGSDHGHRLLPAPHCHPAQEQGAR